MDAYKYIRCIQLIVNEEDYSLLYNYLLKHQDEDPIIKKWLNQECDPFIQGFIKLRNTTEEEKEDGLGNYVSKPV